MGFNMRSLNSFAGGTAQGIGVGSQIANRKKLTDLAVAGDAREGEKMGLLKAADARQTKLYDQYAKIIEKYLGETGSTNLQASLTAQPTPDAQPFAPQAGVAAAFAPQPGQASALQQPAAPTPMFTQQPRRAMPPFADLIGYGG